ncbi:pyruvate kinase [Saccharicrinis sp. FJH54]|uniref:pyruvate kinase n=1 Tax=Saccharicrinis sp. FJH54 TaxID=3344665 RepID=UPI0035D4B85C
MKHTKIVATISDLRCDVGFVRSLYESGMNVVRMNTAHMDHEGINRIITNVREVSDDIAILMDTKGPEIRTTVLDKSLEISLGQKLKLKGAPGVKSSSDCICVSYDKIVDDVSVGSNILIDDGEIDLKVVEKDDEYLYCEALNNGELGSRKSVNVPGVRINLPSLTEKDISNIGFAIEKDIDFIAHSFVRSAQDVNDIQKLLDAKNSKIKIIAKIENQEGVENIHEILDVVYGVMVARGDLGIEIAQEKIPGIQRHLIRECVLAKKPVIVATQMLHSMIKYPRPTRAEVTDIANAIYYRTDALMLSGETAYGQFPVESVKTMARIAEEAEKTKMAANDIRIPFSHDDHDVTAFLSKQAVKAASRVNTKAVLTDSSTGRTARILAAFRGRNPVYAQCYNKRTMRELALSYGVFASYLPADENSKEYICSFVKDLISKKLIREQDLVLYLGGSVGIGGGTFIELFEAGKPLQAQKDDK